VNPKSRNPLHKEEMKLKKGDLKHAPGVTGGKDAFGFSKHSKRHPPAEKKSPAQKPSPSEKAKPSESTAPKHEAHKPPAVPKEETFGFGKDSPKYHNKIPPKKSGVSKPTLEKTSVLDRAQEEHMLSEKANELHVWVNGKPGILKKLEAKKKIVQRQKTAKALPSPHTDPKKEISQKSKANRQADDLHIWVNGKPHVSKLAKKTHKAVVHNTIKASRTHNDLGEGMDINEVEAEGIEKMRAMKLIAKHIQDTSQSLSEQNKIPSDAEYNFSIRNTDEHDQSMGVAKNIQLEAILPKGAKLMDAYFYLEATKPHEDPQSKSCQLEQDSGDGVPRVRCVVPYIKDLVDVYVRAHYNGDQKALESLSSHNVDVTLHEGHEVLKNMQLSAVQSRPLLKRCIMIDSWIQTAKTRALVSRIKHKHS